MCPESPAPRGKSGSQPTPTEFRETASSRASLTWKKQEDDSDGPAHN